MKSYSLKVCLGTLLVYKTEILSEKHRSVPHQRRPKKSDRDLHYPPPFFTKGLLEIGEH
jgi:hypothetical protein